MFGDGVEQSTILRTVPDGLTRVITRSSWAERESVLVDAQRPHRTLAGRRGDDSDVRGCGSECAYANGLKRSKGEAPDVSRRSAAGN